MGRVASVFAKVLLADSVAKMQTNLTTAMQCGGVFYFSKTTGPRWISA
jgi:hypothetical protein